MPKFLIYLAAILFGFGPVSAQDSVRTSLASPSDIPVEAFTGQAMLQTAKLSEGGARFAYILGHEEKYHLVIVDATTRETVYSIDIGTKDKYNWFRWAGDDRILISRSLETTIYGFPITRLLLLDIPTRNLAYLGFKTQGMEGDDILFVDPAGQYIVLSVSKDIFDNPEVWRFPLDGTGEDGAVLVQKSQKDVAEWWADDHGIVRLGMSWSRQGATKIYYRSGPGGKFERVTKLGKNDDVGRDAWDVMGIYAGRDTGYAMVDGPDGKTILREIDYSTGELGRTVYENERWAVQGTMMRRGVGPVGAEYVDDMPQTIWFDEQLAAYQTALEAALPGGRISILSLSSSDRMLVTQTGDADPGALYVFSPAANQLDLYGNLRPDIDFRLLSPSSAHDIVTRDGNIMRAFLTLPKDRDPTGLPLIIMPHGGPYGVRDYLVYDDWTQLLASRGYAVLRANYRGSGGYGEAFERLGDGQIGRGMQDDIDDAMDWAVEQGYVDAGRVCLVGASYGGYAAMWGAIRNPERYRCAASFAGVTDWEDLLKYDKDYLGRGSDRRKWYRRTWKPRVTGDDGFDLSTVSVVDQIHRLERPVLVAHGKKDRRVPWQQFEDLRDAAGKHGVGLELLELEGDHHLTDRAEETKMLEAFMAFLQKHNPPAE